MNSESPTQASSHPYPVFVVTPDRVQVENLVQTLIESVSKCVLDKGGCTGAEDEVTQARAALIEAMTPAGTGATATGTPIARIECTVDGSVEYCSLKGAASLPMGVQYTISVIPSWKVPKSAPAAQSLAPLFWYRPRSDVGYEGPIPDARMDEVRKACGSWVPLVPQVDTGNANLNESVAGDLLPPVGSLVLAHLGRSDAWVPHMVTGYYVWGDLGGNANLQRVFVRLRDAAGFTNARMLRDLRTLEGAPLVKESKDRLRPAARVASVNNGSYERNYRVEFLRDVNEGALLYTSAEAAES